MALTETALLIGLFLLPIYGILVTHRLVDAHLQVATVAREAARVMAEAPSAEVATLMEIRDLIAARGGTGTV